MVPASMPPPSPWVGPGVGPLVVVPLDALPGWEGGPGEVLVDDEDLVGDFGRARAVADALADVIDVGGVSVLVLGVEDVDTCYVPEHRAFVRRVSFQSDEEVLAVAEGVLADPDLRWDDCGTWETRGPAMLMDADLSGVDVVGFEPDDPPEWTPVPITAGRWRVRAVYADVGDCWLIVVQLRP